MTLVETTFEPTWEENIEIARMLEAGGFECMVPIAPLAGHRRSQQLQQQLYEDIHLGCSPGHVGL
jgi:hypothetical protein